MTSYLKIISDINNRLFKQGLGSGFFFKRGDEMLPVTGNPLFDSLGGMALYVGEILKEGVLIGEWHVRKETPFSEEEVKALDEILLFLKEEVFFEEWEYTYKFVQNRSCAYFPCHKVTDENSFNCLFCYCPLYFFEDCGGNKKILENGVKDCSACLFPHKKGNYEKVIERFRKKSQG